MKNQWRKSNQEREKTLLWEPCPSQKCMWPFRMIPFVSRTRACPLFFFLFFSGSGSPISRKEKTEKWKKKKMKRKNEKKERKNHDSGRIWNDGISQSEERRKVMTFSKEDFQEKSLTFHKNFFFINNLDPQSPEFNLNFN